MKRALAFQLPEITLKDQILLCYLQGMCCSQWGESHIGSQMSKVLFQKIAYHSNSSTHCFRWKVMPELCSYNTTVSMRSCDLSPHYSHFTGFLISLGYRLSFGTVDKGNTFAKVEICFILGSYSFDS